MLTDPGLVALFALVVIVWLLVLLAVWSWLESAARADEMMARRRGELHNRRGER